MRYLAIVLSVLVCGCSSTPKMEDCPSVAEEPVSMCRAEAACGPHGFTGRLGLIMGGFGKNGNRAAERIEYCRDSNLSAQRTNASIAAGQPINERRCVSEKVGDRVVTKCD